MNTITFITPDAKKKAAWISNSRARDFKRATLKQLIAMLDFWLNASDMLHAMYPEMNMRIVDTVRPMVIERELEIKRKASTGR